MVVMMHDVMGTARGVSCNLRFSWITLALMFAWCVSAQANTGGCEVLVVVGLADEAEIAAGQDVKVVISAANADLLRERLAEVDVTRLSAVVSFGIAVAVGE